jgi:2-methylisocitrate lyase-like PEP mutase family enzyme
MDQAQLATLLRSLHKQGDPLILLNAWDAGSARLIEQAGAKAIATTSAGVALALGYPDGQKLPWPEQIANVRRIARVVRLPISADVESGYAASPARLQHNIGELIDAGAAGLNLEDATDESTATARKKNLFPFDQQVASLRAVRDAGEKKGVPIVINARTDAYWADSKQPEEARIVETIRRGRAYIEAGADCIFVPGATSLSVIKRLVDEIGAPINVLAGKGALSIAELARAGVARISVGSGLFRSAYAYAQQAAAEVFQTGVYTAFTETTIQYHDFNRLYDEVDSR